MATRLGIKRRGMDPEGDYMKSNNVGSFLLASSDRGSSFMIKDIVQTIMRLVQERKVVVSSISYAC